MLMQCDKNLQTHGIFLKILLKKEYGIFFEDQTRVI